MLRVKLSDSISEFAVEPVSYCFGRLGGSPVVSCMREALDPQFDAQVCERLDQA
ncbi:MULTISPECIES: hypothetical protein [unclassified Mycobacterium]|uniref:hypothetical protein n=1 Tax=unclassified Mycobacterium TaxID=2642494 RepID=UPI0012E3BF5A|nr:MULTISPECIES: hypothetical protein [unclassified Mycobacterium]